MPERKARKPSPDRSSSPAAAKSAIGEEERLSLQRAFETFQRQSDMLESSHRQLQLRLKEAQLDLEKKNRQLAASVAEMAAMKEKLAGILESISDAVLLAAPDGSLSVANEAASCFLSDCGRPGCAGLSELPELEAALKGKEHLKDEILVLQTPSGKRRYMLSALKMKGRKAGSELVLSLKDVTELMELQERVGREDRMAALGRVAASVAHEIRNPLGAIEGFGILLERDLKESPSLLRLASKTVYAARQLNSVVSNLLSYTREVRVDMAPCELPALVEEALEFVKPMAVDRKASISLAPFGSQPPSALVDRRQMSQVLINVMMNAVEACPHRGGGAVSIACSISKDGRSASIEVSDNGPGVPQGLKKRIFEPFFTTKDGGTGLGLSLCQRIVEAHGGSISEAGAEGTGARFVIELKASGAVI